MSIDIPEDLLDALLVSHDYCDAVGLWEVVCDRIGLREERLSEVIIMHPDEDRVRFVSDWRSVSAPEGTGEEDPRNG